MSFTLKTVLSMSTIERTNSTMHRYDPMLNSIGELSMLIGLSDLENWNWQYYDLGVIEGWPYQLN